jgi:hypothetical protein
MAISKDLLGSLAQTSNDLIDIAKQIGDIAANVQDSQLKERLAGQINRILDLAQRNNVAVQSAISS